MDDIYLKGFIGLIFVIGIWFINHRVKKARKIIEINKDNMSYNNFHQEKKEMDFWIRRKHLEKDYLLFEITDKEEYINLMNIYEILKSGDKIDLKDEYSKKGLDYFNGEDMVILNKLDMKLESDMNMAPGYRSSNMDLEEFLEKILNMDFKNIEIFGILKDGYDYDLIDIYEEGLNHGIILLDKGKKSYEDICLLVEFLKSFSMKNIISNREYDLF